MDFEKLGPYRIGDRLGKGGMGSVYRGEHLESGDRVAVKALAPQLASSEGFRERFEAEIESLKTLQHEGIVRLYGYGEEVGTLFYAMELVDGRSLEEELKAGRRFTWREVVDISIQVCRALKHAHDHGIVHRDIKPANILLDGQDQVKLADFGIARLFGGSQLTIAGGVLGTADYMSPEQADGRPVNDRCDQYSLGCVMYALLAGRPPFRANTLPEMLQLQRFAQPEPVRRYAPEAPEQLENCISQLLKKEPADRFPNTMVLARHLEAMRKALSRPFNKDGNRTDDTASTGNTLDPVSPLASTQANTNLADDEFSQSVDDHPVPTAIRDAVTVDSLTDSATRQAITEATKADHFTTIEETRRPLSSGVPSSVWVGSVGLFVMFGVIVWFVWQVMQPRTADELFLRIQPSESEPSVDHLRLHEADVDEFLERFADDPRAEQVMQYQEELDLERLERRFDTLLRGRGKRGDLITAERLYLQAMRLAESNPTQAIYQLSTLEKLFAAHSSDVEADDESQQRLTACLELARRQRMELETRMGEQTEVDLATLDQRLVDAELLYESSPDQALEIVQAVVELYRGKSWAEPVVNRAEQLLARWR